MQLNHACHDYSMSSCESNLKLENVIVETEAQQLIKRAKAKELYDVCYILIICICFVIDCIQFIG